MNRPSEIGGGSLSLTAKEIAAHNFDVQVHSDEIQKELHHAGGLMFKRVQDLADMKEEQGSTGTAAVFSTAASTKKTTGHPATSNSKVRSVADKQQQLFETFKNDVFGGACQTSTTRGIRSSAFSSPKNEITIKSQLMRPPKSLKNSAVLKNVGAHMNTFIS